MELGLLIFDDSKSPLVEKVIRAMKKYSDKLGRVPNLCFVNPSAMPEQLIDLDAIKIRPYRVVLPGHLWIGIEDAKKE